MTTPSIEELRAKCQPPEVLARRNAEHWGGRLYARRLSIRVTWLAVRLNLSAGAVTASSVAVGMLAAAAVAVPPGPTEPTVWGPLAAVILLQIHLVLDCSDGEVARWNDTTSAAGIFFDRLGHYLIDAAVIVALGYRAYNGSEVGWFVLGLVAALGALLVKVETDLVDKARAAAGLAALEDGNKTRSNSVVSRARRLADFMPVHRVLNAIEASILILLAAIVDVAVGSYDGSRGALILIVAVAWLMVPAHAYAIVSSGRLESR